MKFHFNHFVASLALASLSSLSYADTHPPQDALYPELPKWEVGAGFAAILMPDYPGSNETHARYLPLPYLIYRGDVIRSDRNGGLRGLFLSNAIVEFDLSLSAAFPANSGDNEARAEMDDIDWMGEVGPRLVVHMHKGPIVKVDLALPVRYVFSTDFRNFNSRGYVFNPELKFAHRALFDPQTSFSASLGPTWATESTMDYLYQVDLKDARAGRPTYNAQAGYMGLGASIFISRNWPGDVRTFIGVSKDFYADAKNRRSSLLRDIETESYFLGIVWSFWHSKDKAQSTPSTEVNSVEE